MPIKVNAIEAIPHIEGNSQFDRTYASLQVFDANGTIVAAPRVPIEDMPEDVAVGDFLMIVKAD
jgi:hypothetical protein